MRISDRHTQYTLLDASGGERLEDWSGIILIRPDPQVIWNTPKTDPRWRTAHARYIRSSSGGGGWQSFKSVPESWQLHYGKLTFNLKPMGFKHTGLFPEQAVNWDFIAGRIAARKAADSAKPFKVLNLFAYTGAATLAALSAGAEAVHVDAAKGMVAWARDNAAASGLGEAKCRWLIDDCVKFVEREIRRGNKYDGIIMDPPSYGRGPSGEVWQLEKKIWEFCELSAQLLSPDADFFILNSYTTGLSASTMGYLLSAAIGPRLGGSVTADELGLPVKSTGLALPCGAAALWTPDK